MFDNSSTITDSTRMVLFEKFHPFISTILKSLDCPLMNMELFFYKNDFIVYQESPYAGEKIYGIDMVLVRILYFDMSRLKWLENEATFPGIISRSNWHWLAMNYADHYIGERGGYITTTGLLFIHKSCKSELINALISFKKYITHYGTTFKSMKDVLISSHLPVRKCKTLYHLNNKEDKNFIYKVADDEQYRFNQTKIEDFKRDVFKWQDGKKNVMIDYVNFDQKSKSFTRGMYA